MHGFNATLNYRIPSPDTMEIISILLNEWSLSLGVQIAALIVLITSVIGSFFGLKTFYIFIREKMRKKPSVAS
jgi:hypothetical protein